MLTLGFTNIYYTLWNVEDPIEKNNFLCQSVQMVQTCSYIQNLSMDYSKALEKIKKRAGSDKFEIDLDLKGEYSFERVVSERSMYQEWQFTFGKLAGNDIRTCEDVWQLNRAVKEEKGERRKVYARRRLIELGELVRNPYRSESDGCYIRPERLKYLQEKSVGEQVTGHYYTDGERVTIALKRVNGFYYKSVYGNVYIEIYETVDGKPIKYKGSSPLDIGDEFITVIGTVEHGEYKGLPETRLKRMKMANKKAA